MSVGGMCSVLILGRSVAILLSVLCLVSSTTADWNIVQSHVLYRHGDRSPVRSFPTDPNQENDWPQGFGQLTQEGMREQYELGQWLRKRYNNTLLSPIYDRTQIHVRSTDIDRTLMSAQCNLAGLYAPQGTQVWNPNIFWQPIPVHTVKNDNEILLHMPSCPKYEQLLETWLKNDTIQKYLKHNENFFNSLKESTGWEGDFSFWNISSVADALYFENKAGLKLAEWANQTVLNKLQEYGDWKYSVIFGNGIPFEMKRIRSGVIMTEIISHVKNMTDLKNENKDPTNVYMYSAHDSTVAPFLSAFNLFNNRIPPTASCVLTELVHNPSTNQHMLQIFFRNETAEVSQPLYNETAEEFIRQMEKMVVEGDDRQVFTQLCHLDDHDGDGDDHHNCPDDDHHHDDDDDGDDGHAGHHHVHTDHFIFTFNSGWLLVLIMCGVGLLVSLTLVIGALCFGRRRRRTIAEHRTNSVDTLRLLENNISEEEEGEEDSL